MHNGGTDGPSEQTVVVIFSYEIDIQITTNVLLC